MFNGCSSLESLPDISNWNTNNIINISYLFSYCSSLKLLPDISKWNLSNVRYFSNIFNGCSLLKSLPDKYSILEQLRNKKCIFIVSFIPHFDISGISSNEEHPSNILEISLALDKFQFEISGNFFNDLQLPNKKAHIIYITCTPF